MAKVNLLTQKGYDELVNELQDLKLNKRPEIAQKIKEAREQGDLSENAEYSAAKEEQGIIESRINTIEAILENYKIVESHDFDKSVVSYGSKVDLIDLSDNKKYTYTLVGAMEADIVNKKISDASPLGKAILNARVGTVVKYINNEGLQEEYKVQKIYE